MSNESLAFGSEEHFETESGKFRIWRTHSFAGGRRRPIRRWYVDILPSQVYSSREDAVSAGWTALAYQNGFRQFDSAFGELFGEFDMAARAEPAAPEKDDHSSRCEKLRNITVERGATPAEAEVARQKLERLEKIRKEKKA